MTNRISRILIVLEVGDAWPSGLVRGLIYKDFFIQHGFHVRYINRRLPILEKMQSNFNLIPIIMIAAGFKKILNKLNLLFGVLNECRIAKIAKNFDVVYLLKTDSYSLVTKLRLTTHARLVFDLNDGLWLPRFFNFANGRIADILREVDAVMSDNEYGIAFARQYNAHTYMVPEHPQVELFDAQRCVKRKDKNEIVIGWVGSPGTVFNLFSIWEPLERLFAKHQNLRLRLLGVGNDPLILPRFEHVRYTKLPFYKQSEMIQEVLNMEIGLFPLFDIEDSYARGIMKATIYMSGGVATICSAIGACNRLISDGINGMLAHSPEEWFEKLNLLVSQPELRQRVAKGGLDLIRREYTIEHSFARLIKALEGE